MGRDLLAASVARTLTPGEHAQPADDRAPTLPPAVPPAVPQDRPLAGLLRIVEPAIVFAVVLAVYVAVTPQTNPAYRHFVYIASAFLDGRVHLENLPGHYHDIIKIGDRVYAPFPPVPALLILPVVAVYGEATDQGRVGQVVVAAAVAVFVAGLRRLGQSRGARWFAGAALAFGSVLWPAAAIGTTWFFAQEVVVLASAVIVWEIAGAASPIIVGAAITAAWLTRLNLIAAIPALAVVMWLRHRRVGAIATFVAINAVGAFIYASYNYLRFGDPLQTGYGVLSMAAFNADTASRWGFFHLRFIPEHLYAMLVRAPELIDVPPFLKPSPHGLSLLLTSPVILRLLFPAQRANEPAHGASGTATGGARSWGVWVVLTLSLLLPLLPYFSIGWVQYGYRYSLDWWVYVMVLLSMAIGPRPRAVDYALLTLSVGMNLLGVYWVRTLGW
jgi:hypothetical protein